MKPSDEVEMSNMLVGSGARRCRALGSKGRLVN